MSFLMWLMKFMKLFYNRACQVIMTISEPLNLQYLQTYSNPTTQAKEYFVMDAEEC